MSKAVALTSSAVAAGLRAVAVGGHHPAADGEGLARALPTPSGLGGERDAVPGMYHGKPFVGGFCAAIDEVLAPLPCTLDNLVTPHSFRRTVATLIGRAGGAALAAEMLVTPPRRSPSRTASSPTRR